MLSIKEEPCVFHHEVLSDTDVTWRHMENPWIISVAVSAKVKPPSDLGAAFNSGRSPRPCAVCKAKGDRFSPPHSQPNAELRTDPHRQGKVVFQVLNKALCPLLLRCSGAGNFCRSRLRSGVCDLPSPRSYALQRPWVSRCHFQRSRCLAGSCHHTELLAPRRKIRNDASTFHFKPEVSGKNWENSHFGEENIVTSVGFRVQKGLQIQRVPLALWAGEKIPSILTP